MNKKELITPVLFSGIGLVFVFISFMVWSTKGKSAKWVARKMKMGGILLSLSWFSCNNIPEERGLPISCYFIFYETAKTSIEIDTNRVIYGSVSKMYDNLSYSLSDTTGVILKKDKLYARTYMLEPESKEFIIQLDNKIKEGNYVFKLFSCNSNEQDTTKEFYSQKITLMKN